MLAMMRGNRRSRVPYRSSRRLSRLSRLFSAALALYSAEISEKRRRRSMASGQSQSGGCSRWNGNIVEVENILTGKLMKAVSCY